MDRKRASVNDPGGSAAKGTQLLPLKIDRLEQLMLGRRRGVDPPRLAVSSLQYFIVCFEKNDFELVPGIFQGRKYLVVVREELTLPDVYSQRDPLHVRHVLFAQKQKTAQ
jgi:hypothetical protein